jgi:hypothetical protein
MVELRRRAKNVTAKPGPGRPQRSIARCLAFFDVAARALARIHIQLVDAV